MCLQTVMYVSSSRLDPASALATIDNIVSASALNNQKLELTGALIFTGVYFIQVLEGAATTLNSMMDVLAKDTRHSNVKVSANGLNHRRFAQWRMAYVGPSTLVDRRVRRLIAGADALEANRVSEWLRTLVADFDSNVDPQSGK